MKGALISVFFFGAALGAVAQETRLADATAEWLSGGDVQLYAGWAAAEIPAGQDRSWRVRMDAQHQSIEYRPNAPIDPLGIGRDRAESLAAVESSLELRKGRDEWSLTVNTYTGFRNFSSIWIDEYYRQQYSGGGIPGAAYAEPDPWGVGASASWRREVIPAAGYLNLSAGYLHDRVAPGYEIEDLGTAFALVQGTSRLRTFTAAAGWEGILNRMARAQLRIRLTDTTERDPRITWNGALNTLLAGNWISRSAASVAFEDPGFESWSVSQTLERPLTARWSASLTLRYYEDTGQIEAANLVSSAAPALQSLQGSVGLRRDFANGLSSFSFSTGPYQTRYAATGLGTERFRHLYDDRDWWWTRLALRLAF